MVELSNALWNKENPLQYTLFAVPIGMEFEDIKAFVDEAIHMTFLSKKRMPMHGFRFLKRSAAVVGLGKERAKAQLW